ncbi:MAG TPA: hypothetical protein VJZ00_14275 [Thermoanaerobaculia bacterium]|nr:hypothetical protein [Thermoanaerobaculia bacterium]
MSDPHHDPAASERLDPPVSISHFVRVLRSYLPIITLSLAVVIVGYIIVALAAYIMAPSQHVTTLPFRLEFEGADRGTYPNGTKFSSAEITTTPVLLKAFNENQLSRFVTFNEFARSVFVLEANGAQEALARDYQSRLSDPRLTPVDRDRIQREYELKLASLSKSEFAINYLHTGRGEAIPDVVVRKALHDVLRKWSEFVSTEQHVLQYRVAVLSPDIMTPTRIEEHNPIISAEVLRAKILRVQQNINELRALPSSELVRSKPDGLSLNDISIRFDDLVRFRLEPLIHEVARAGLDDRPSTIQFLETQLAYDERQLEARRSFADAVKNAMVMYTSGQITERQQASAALNEMTQRGTPQKSETETVMPQISDSFLDKLMQITTSSADHEYRQRLADAYREIAVGIVPIEQSVSYDRSVLELVRSAGGGGTLPRDAAAQQIATTRQEARQLVTKIREMYDVLSTNLTPSTELMTVTGAPTSRVERTINIRQLGLYGILTCFIALPLIIFACLVHNRIREEEATGDLEPQPTV